jgi:aspartyl-tRNA(Asn)/glutamyl-tRNA(Gln) amidotransferase subunit A
MTVDEAARQAGPPEVRASIRSTRERLQRGEASVTDLVAATLAAIEAVDGTLGAYVAVDGDRALEEAAVLDRRIGQLGPTAWTRRPLIGTTVAVKDLIQTADLPTTRGSLLTNRRPRHDAPSVARLRAAGAIVIGKTTTSEFGWSASTVSRVARPTANPWALDRSAGGSSGGSAAAVAAGLCGAALGTDGAGSIRIPAAFCGVVGYKPSFGVVPYVPPCADRLAHQGPLTRTVADAVELARVIAGPDRRDPDSAGFPAAEPALGRPLRIGWVEFPGTSAEVRRVSGLARAALARQGELVDLDGVPFPDPYRALLALVAAAEAGGTAPDDGRRCDPGRLAVVRHGRTVSGADVLRAEETRLDLRATLGRLHERVDLLAMATVPIEPFAVDAIAPDWAADPADLRWLAWSPASYPFNLTGQPAVSLPVGLTRSGLPVGVQLVGPVGADRLVLAAAQHLEAAVEPLPAPRLVGLVTSERTR